jgi:glutathione S-transferase
MTTPKLALYTDVFWISPYVFTAFVALHEKVLPFETHPISLGDKEQRVPAFRDRTVTARVPALDHDGFWISESSAIVEYLDDAFPETPRALPRDLRERARARQILAWIRSDLDALRAERPTTTMFYDPTDKPLSAAGQEAADKLLHVAELLLPAGATSLFGDYSAADTDLAFLLHRLILNGHPVAPRLRAFAEAQWARPSVRAFRQRVRPAFVPY